MIDPMQQPEEIKLCKKCGKHPRWRLRGYSTMVFCPNKCCSVIKANFPAAVQAWNKANEAPHPAYPTGTMSPQEGDEVGGEQ